MARVAVEPKNCRSINRKTPAMTSFQTVRARAEQRKGGADKLNALIPPKHDAAALAALSDDRVLAEMAKRIFTSFSSHGAV